MLISLFFLATNLVYISVSKEDCFIDAVYKLKRYDRRLSSRHTQKNEALKNSSNLGDFIEFMKKVQSKGTTFSSKSTSDWISEIIEGLEASYNVSQRGMSSQIYADFKELKEIFLKVTRWKMYYKVKISGVFEHFWLVEKLPENQGYRIYQSYQDAFSLNAWLASDESEMNYLWSTGDIIYWHENYKRLDKLLKKIGVTMESLDKLSDHYFIKPWMKYVKDNSREDIIRTFITSWSKYGGGKTILSKTFHEEYLQKLMNLTTSIRSLIGKTDLWTERLHEEWIELFGSPNVFVYPNTPFSAMTKLFPSNLTVEVQELQETEEIRKNLRKNANTIRLSLKDEDIPVLCSNGCSLLLKCRETNVMMLILYLLVNIKR